MAKSKKWAKRMSDGELSAVITHSKENDFRKAIWKDLWNPELGELELMTRTDKHYKNAEKSGLTTYRISRLYDEQRYMFRCIMSRRYPGWNINTDKPSPACFGGVR